MCLNTLTTDYVAAKKNKTKRKKMVRAFNLIVKYLYL